MATGMHSHSTPGTFFSLCCRLYVYNQHTQQFARWFGDYHVTHIPTSTVRHVGCRIVYERSKQKRQLNNESGLAKHPKGLRWSSYTPGAAEQSLKPAHMAFLKKIIIFATLEVRFFYFDPFFDVPVRALICACIFQVRRGIDVYRVRPQHTMIGGSDFRQNTLKYIHQPTPKIIFLSY